MQEWRSQQLASGGALENANFQPLGTLDWFVSTGHNFLVDRL